MTINWLLSYVTQINLIALVVCSFKLPLQTTMLDVPWSTHMYEITLFHSGNPLQLLQQVSEYVEFWFLLLKFSKYTLFIKNLTNCQAEIGSSVQVT